MRCARSVRVIYACESQSCMVFGEQDLAQLARLANDESLVPEGRGQIWAVDAVIRNELIKNVCKFQSCMVSKLRIIWARARTWHASG